MGLKTDIEQAYIDNFGQSIYDQTTQSQKDKLSRLADDLTNAISSFIQAQTFTVTKLQASQQGVSTAPSPSLLNQVVGGGIAGLGLAAAANKAGII